MNINGIEAFWVTFGCLSNYAVYSYIRYEDNWGKLDWAGGQLCCISDRTKWSWDLESPHSSPKLPPSPPPCLYCKLWQVSWHEQPSAPFTVRPHFLRKGSESYGLMSLARSLNLEICQEPLPLFTYRSQACTRTEHMQACKDLLLHSQTHTDMHATCCKNMHVQFKDVL